MATSKTKTCGIAKAKTVVKPASPGKSTGLAAKGRAVRQRTSKLKPEAIAAMFARFAAVTPEPKGELEHSNAYTLLVAVVLSAQATDAGVNKATRALFETVDTAAKMLALGEAGLIEHIKSIGLFRNKAKNVIALSQRLIDEHDGEVPADGAYLESLPGVGRKTANVVMNMAFGMPTMAVDTHVFRVANRTGLAPGKDPLAVETGLLAVVPPAYGVHAHHWLILHGRYVCKARKPDCGACTIRDFCLFPDKTSDT